MVNRRSLKGTLKDLSDPIPGGIPSTSLYPFRTTFTINFYCITEEVVSYHSSGKSGNSRNIVKYSQQLRNGNFTRSHSKDLSGIFSVPNLRRFYVIVMKSRWDVLNLWLHWVVETLNEITEGGFCVVYLGLTQLESKIGLNLDSQLTLTRPTSNITSTLSVCTPSGLT